MKKISATFAFIVTLLIATSSFAATPDQEKSFIDTYKKALEGKDEATLKSLLYTKGADPEALEFFEMMVTAEVGSKVKDIKLRDLTAEEKIKATATLPSPSGGNSKLPVVPTKKLVLSIEASDANGSSSSTSESFVAEVDGKLLIPVPVAVQ